RWPWLALIPLPLLSGGAWRSRLIATTITAVVVGWGLLGFRVALPSFGTPNGATIRVVTFNAALKPAAAETVLADAVAWRADVIAIVECSTRNRPTSDLVMYRFASLGEVCL